MSDRAGRNDPQRGASPGQLAALGAGGYSGGLCGHGASGDAENVRAKPGIGWETMLGIRSFHTKADLDWVRCWQTGLRCHC